MKIKSKLTNALYEFIPKGNTPEERYICPECSAHRKKKTDKCFAWNAVDNIGYCHNCGTSFYVFKPGQEKQYTAPEWKNITQLSDKSVKWFTGRMISQKTLNKMRIYSDTTFMPQFSKEVETICFPYFFQSDLVNIKYRGPQKSFKLHSGAELIFYNQDALLNFEDVIIVEGEIDALSFVECGFDNVVSVPNGANVKLEYLDTYHGLFDKVKKIYLATDVDTKGIELRDELARRLGAERCLIVNFKDCKDANSFLCKYASDFNDLIKTATPIPTRGVVTVDNLYGDIRDLYENGVEPGLALGETFDNFIKWETGRLVIVTGIPSSGKSEFVDYLVTKMNLKFGWRAAYFTPENYPLKYHYGKLYEKIIGKRFRKNSSNELEFEMAFDYIKENFFYIMHEEDFTVDFILNNAKSLIKTRGIKIVVIDPYNKLDHQYTDSETQYISRFLDKLINFAKFNDIIVFLVAHPRKMDKEANGKMRVPSLYDISGSANFYNKTDYGIVVHRQVTENNTMLNKIEVYWSKIKFKHLGEQGMSKLEYDYETGRFSAGSFDKNNWLTKNIEQKIIDYTETTWEQRDEAPY
jgi:twinkle protein